MPNGWNAGAKVFELLCVHGTVFVRAGEVAHENIDIERLNDRIGDVGRRNAEPVYPRIDHQVAWSPAAILPDPCLPETVDHRADACSTGVCCLFCTKDAVKYADLRRRDVAKNRGNFAPVGNEEILAACITQFRHTAIDTEPVTVCLDRGACPATAGHRIQRLPVLRQSVAIDAQPQSRRRTVCHGVLTERKA